MGIFGWDLPPGCSIRDIPGNSLEDELEEAVAEGWRLTCEKCHSYLSFKPDRTEPWESSYECDGRNEYCDSHKPVPHEPHKIVWDAGSTGIHVCKRCGHENKYNF